MESAGGQGSNPNSRTSSRPADFVQARLDLQALDRSVEFYFQNGLASSTQKAYNSAKKRYIQFCSGRGLTPLPASEDQLCQFASSLANQKLCHSSIKSYLAAIRHLHIAERYGDPNISSMARLEQVLKGIKSVQSKGPKTISRLPITPDHLVTMREVWSKQSSSVDGKMLWAAASLFFRVFFAFRGDNSPLRLHIR